MPNPFSSKSQTKATVKPDSVPVENSVLVCDTCFTETDSGLYYPETKVLTFVCTQGHKNLVKRVEI